MIYDRNLDPHIILGYVHTVSSQFSFKILKDLNFEIIEIVFRILHIVKVVCIIICSLMKLEIDVP